MVPAKRTRWAHMFPDQSVRALPSAQYMKAAVTWSRGATTKVVFYACNFEDNTLEHVLESCPELKTLILPCHEVSDHEANKQLFTENDKKIEEFGVPHDLEIIWS